jgi:hypothetical protein
MKPQEKAQELVDKYMYASFNCKDCDMPFCDIKCTQLNLHEAKQCALIAVDEIIKSREEDSHFDDKLLYIGSDYLTLHPMYLTYWLKVKENIEKL